MLCERVAQISLKSSVLELGIMYSELMSHELGFFYMGQDVVCLALVLAEILSIVGAVCIGKQCGGGGEYMEPLFSLSH